MNVEKCNERNARQMSSSTSTMATGSAASCVRCTRDTTRKKGKENLYISKKWKCYELASACKIRENLLPFLWFFFVFAHFYYLTLSCGSRWMSGWAVRPATKCLVDMTSHSMFVLCRLGFFTVDFTPSYGSPSVLNHSVHFSTSANVTVGTDSAPSMNYDELRMIENQERAKEREKNTHSKI